MEVVVAVATPPSTALDFNFDSNCSSPYITAPSSPQRFGNLFSGAPISPTRVSTFLNQLNNFTTTHSSSSSSIPFQWEQHPGVPNDDGFEFNFSGQLEPPFLSAADELFDGGKIKPLKPPPRLHSGEGITSPRSPIKGKKIFYPCHNQKRDNDYDPFEMALEETGRREEEEEEEQQQQRGRERVSSSSSSYSYSYSGRKGTRSLSPFRVSNIMYETDEKVVSSTTRNTKSSSSYLSFLSSIPFTKGYRKWRLKDFLLFRSASEGRATDKDRLRNYDVLSKKATTVEEDVKNSSFRSTQSSGSVSRRRRGPVSAHELHYTMNRAASEEMKKKTLLPYKQGLLGCLGFNPGMNQIFRGIGSFSSRS